MALSKRLRFQVLYRDGFKCRYCGRGHPYTDLEVDHVHPRSRGGSDHMENLATACRDCNRSKRTDVLDLLPADERVRIKENYTLALVYGAFHGHLGDFCYEQLQELAAAPLTLTFDAVQRTVIWEELTRNYPVRGRVSYHLMDILRLEQEEHRRVAPPRRI